MTGGSLLPQEIIRCKRDGAALSAEQIAAFVRGLSDNEIGEGQAAAFAMAVYFQGLSAGETAQLTLAMRDSGRVLDWSGLQDPVLDKHSTGGVGDKVSLVLAPLLAACGAAVPMIAGRGLGHTGGTVDKLEAIPGYDTAPGIARFQAVVREAGCAIIGQTPDLAPADGRLYAVRDVTATIESIPLITASVLSKKLAAGLQGLVMDVKWGNGAFAESEERARRLAESLVETAAGAGLPLTALITDMNQVLGRTAGNALEVREATDALAGRSVDERLRELLLALAGEALVLGGSAESVEEGRERANRTLESGAAAERFQNMVRALGGPGDLLDRPQTYLARAPVERPVMAEKSGWVAAVDTRALGLVVTELGGGRRRPGAEIDPAVGLSAVAGPGTAVDGETPLALIHAASEDAATRAEARVRAAFEIGAEAADQPPVIVGRIEADHDRR